MFQVEETDTHHLEQASQNGRLAWPHLRPNLSAHVIGRFQSKGNFRCDNRTDHFVLHFVIEGRGIMRQGGNRFAIGPGNIFALFPNVPVHYHDHPNSPWRYWWCRLHGQGVATALQLCGITPATPHIHTQIALQLAPLLRQTFLDYKHQTDHPLQSSCLGWQIIDTLIRHSPTSATKLDMAEQVRQFLIQNLNKDISFTQIARRFNTTRVTLFRHFRQAFGIAPQPFLLNIRLKRSELILRDPSIPISEVAEQCGFNSSRYFSRAFKQTYGLSPTTWRRQLLSGPKQR